MKFLMSLVRRYAGTVIGLLLSAFVGGSIITITINKIYNITNNNYYTAPNPPVQSPSTSPNSVVKVDDPAKNQKDDRTEKPIKTRSKKANHSQESPEEWSYQLPVQNSNSIFNRTPSRIITVPVQQSQIPPAYTQQAQSQNSSSYARSTTNVIVQQAPQQRQVIVVQQPPAIRYVQAPGVRYVPFGFRHRRY